MLGDKNTLNESFESYQPTRNPSSFQDQEHLQGIDILSDEDLASQTFDNFAQTLLHDGGGSAKDVKTLHDSVLSYIRELP